MYIYLFSDLVFRKVFKRNNLKLCFLEVVRLRCLFWRFYNREK